MTDLFQKTLANIISGLRKYKSKSIISQFKSSFSIWQMRCRILYCILHPSFMSHLEALRLHAFNCHSLQRIKQVHCQLWEEQNQWTPQASHDLHEEQTESVPIRCIENPEWAPVQRPTALTTDSIDIFV